MQPHYYIGIMTGTSLDGIDCVITDLSDHRIQCVSTHFTPYSASLRAQLKQVCQNKPMTIEQLATLDVTLGALFASSVKEILKQYQLHHTDINAIGCHGQTVWHSPNQHPACTFQIGDPNVIAAETHITTIADFRRQDVALGGQGAPLAPLFHQALCPASTHDQWVLNLGGIANLSFIPHSPSGTLQGFDCGPANLLLDDFYQTHHQQLFDDEGQWASQGQVIEPLLNDMLQDPFFQLAPPKSTGREKFNRDWLQQHLHNHRQLSPVNIQRTLLELTVSTITNALQSIPNNATNLWVCGGGAYNRFLLKRLSICSGLSVQTTLPLGIAPEWIEASCFAWLAQQRLLEKSVDTRLITGAQRPLQLGCSWQ